MTGRIIFTAVFLVCIGGCRGITGTRGSGVAKTEIREVGQFEGISLAGTGRLEVTVGPAGPLTITTDDNLLPLITTTVSDNCLTIRPSESINPQTPLVMKLTAPSIKSLRVSGAATCLITDLDASELALDVSGAATIEAEGRVRRLSVDMSGASDAKAFNLKVEDAAVTISGAGAAEIHAEKTLTANISGAGVVTYTGDPKVTKTISGIGKVTRKK